MDSSRGGFGSVNRKPPGAGMAKASLRSRASPHIRATTAAADLAGAEVAAKGATDQGAMPAMVGATTPTEPLRQKPKRVALRLGGKRTVVRELEAEPAAAEPAPEPEPVRAPEPEPVAASAPAPKPTKGEMSRQEWVEKTYPQHPPEVQHVIVLYGYGEADKHEPSWKPPARPSGPKGHDDFDPARPPGFLYPFTHPYTSATMITKARTVLKEECAKWAVSGDVEKDAETLMVGVQATRYKAIIADLLRKVESGLDRLQSGQGVTWWMQQVENELLFLEIKPDKRRFKRRFSQEWVQTMLEHAIEQRIQVFAELHESVPQVKFLRASQMELFKRLRTKFRTDAALSLSLQANWDCRYAAQQAIHEVWSRTKLVKDSLEKLRKVRAVFAEKQSLLDGSEKSLGPEANLWSSPGEGGGYAELVAQQVEARRQKALQGSGVVVNARGAWVHCLDLAEREIKASDERQERIKTRLEEVERVKRFLEKEHETAREGLPLIEKLNKALENSKGFASSVDDVKAFEVELNTRCAKLGALRGKVPNKVAELQGCFEAARQHGAVLQTVRSLARSEIYNHDQNDEDDVVFERERTLEERNKEGFANAIVLSSDDEDEARPAKKSKSEASPGGGGRGVKVAK